MKNKKIAVLLVAVLALTVFVGCGKKSEETAADNSKVNYAGDYQDKVSERAVMTILKNEDGNYSAIVDWADTAAGIEEWTMTLKQEGDKLVYDDGEHIVINFSETGEEASRTEKGENLEGYFKIISDNELEWHGSDKSETGTFVKE